MAKTKNILSLHRPDVSPDAASKSDLRRLIRARLKTASAGEIERKSHFVRHQLLADDTWLGPHRTVALFGGLPGEVDLLPLLAEIRAHGARPVFFTVREKDLIPYMVQSSDDLVRGTLGVWMPAAISGRQIDPAELDVVLTPGLAFGREDGTRLGRGAGFYDRFFALPGVRARRIGVTFDCQVMEGVPVEAHDARMDALVTESGWLRF